MSARNVSLAGHAIRIQGGSEQIENILSFMFQDVPAEEIAQSEAEFVFAPHGNEWQVTVDGSQKFRDSSLVDTAHYLMGEVLFRLIRNNISHLAIHAALVSDASGGLLLPGESGNGKSSLCIWMTKNGYRYHTDELVLLKLDSFEVSVFTRPVSIKTHGIEAIRRLIDVDGLRPAAIRGKSVTMIPHRALNSDFTALTPEITGILFPRFDNQGDNSLTPLTKASAGIELMKSNVIARNLPEHGFSQLTEVIKSVPACKLEYNHFAALPDLINEFRASHTNVD